MDVNYLIKVILLVIQLVCLYQVLKNERFWVIPIQFIIAVVVMVM